MRVAIVYNEPLVSRYNAVGESKAVLGVLEAVGAVQKALLENSCDVLRVPLEPPIESAESTIRSIDADLVFNLFEGFSGYPETEACIPEILAKNRIACTGCSGAALRLALDKAKMKVVLKSAGIKTPDFQLLNPETLRMFNLAYPCIVKPRCEDASHGLTPDSVVSDFPALEKQVRLVSNTYNGGALVEEFIDGREFNATVLGNYDCTVLPVSEIVYSLPSNMPKVLTFDAKWKPDSMYYQGTKAVHIADLSVEELDQINDMVMAVFKLIGCKGYARVDMMMDNSGQLYVLEVNPNPDITPGCGAARQAEDAGITYAQFIKKIMQLALEQK